MAQLKTSKFNELSVQYCRYCGKECKSLNSLKQHECRCRENPDRRCQNNLADYITTHRKGKNKDNCEEIARQVETMRSLYENGYVNPNKGKPGTFLGKHHTDATKNRISKGVSESRKAGYANGTITPARGVGRGKYSYVIYKDKRHMMRSTYEFIYALYLISHGIDFETESVRVSVTVDNKYTSTFISDFSIGNKIVEIKGIKSIKDVYERDAFENAGYEFVELYEDDINKIKEELISSGYNIEEMLTNIIEGHNNRHYYEYCAD